MISAICLNQFKQVADVNLSKSLKTSASNEARALHIFVEHMQMFRGCCGLDSNVLDTPKGKAKCPKAVDPTNILRTRPEIVGDKLCLLHFLFSLDSHPFSGSLCLITTPQKSIHNANTVRYIIYF